ncbi:hypothetical protein HRbin01_01937 [archaeon HR01]|nr:hypothetical protein HRbin01_01937 [archaeon HR01]
MRAERLLLAIVVLASLTTLAYSAALSTAQVSQVGGTGLVNVSKADVRVLSVKLGSADFAVSTIDVVTLSLSSTVSGSYLVQVFVSVGTCSASGSTTASLSPTATTLTVDVSPDCAYSSQATVRVRVTQP